MQIIRKYALSNKLMPDKGPDQLALLYALDAIHLKYTGFNEKDFSTLVSLNYLKTLPLDYSSEHFKPPLPQIYHVKYRSFT